MQKSATRNSLVVLDELGRGTATSDGQAIAYVEPFLYILLLELTVIIAQITWKLSVMILQGIRTWALHRQSAV